MTPIASLIERLERLTGPVSRTEARGFELGLPHHLYGHAELLGGALEGGVRALGCAKQFVEAVLPGKGVTLVWGYDDAPNAMACAYVDIGGEIISHPILSIALVLAALKSMEARGEG